TDLLCDPNRCDVTAGEHLEKTDITKVLYRLLESNSNGGVKWAGWAGNSSRAPAEQEAFYSSLAGEDPSDDATASLRSKCLQLLVSTLRPQPHDLDKATELAAQVEQHIHCIHKCNQVKYKACVRSKVANLKNPKNGHLHLGLMSGSLTPEAFARMSAEEMACAELQQLRAEYSSRGVSERQLPRRVEGTETRRLRCERCGSSDCRVTQVNRGALFLPAWVRRGSPDDQAMTFVTCSSCGQQWYHSGWVCL
ncbi:transcription elongation factor A N-terminal and central domain-containing protein, partial [Hippocampus comes]|uniref:transcription elongation factor A N-terminal and central domain-containing protein n=1 Tax=Hippocampus comes TaxID=109280 RepID=UPI00094E771D